MLFSPIIRVTAVISIMKDKLTRKRHMNVFYQVLHDMEAFKLKTPQAQGEMSIFMLRFDEEWIVY